MCLFIYIRLYVYFSHSVVLHTLVFDTWVKEAFCSANTDTVSKMEREETYIMPYWNAWSSDFYGWMEELRAQGAYDTLLDLARTYWAHFPLTSYLGYNSVTYPGQSEDTGN